MLVVNDTEELLRRAAVSLNVVKRNLSHRGLGRCIHLVIGRLTSESRGALPPLYLEPSDSRHRFRKNRPQGKSDGLDLAGVGCPCNTFRDVLSHQALQHS